AAFTVRVGKRPVVLMLSPVVPSLKLLPAASPLWLANGSPAIEGRSGCGEPPGLRQRDTPAPIKATTATARAAPCHDLRVILASTCGILIVGLAPVLAPTSIRYTLTGRAIFLTLRSPTSVSVSASLSPIWLRTVPEMQIPPGCASASSRTATLTPAP